VKSRPVVRAQIAFVAFALLSGGCAAEQAPLDWLRPASPIAQDIGNLWTVVFWAAVAVFFIVEGLIVVALIRFRERKGDDGTKLPKQTHGNTRLELGWTALPALLLLVLALPTLAGIAALAREKPNSLQVKVTGFQWWWQYEYADEKVVTANELHIPVNRPIRLALNSADIIHSFWVPRLAGKQDVVPARTNYLTIQANRPGEYFGTCVEYCGLSHANMRLRVFAHSQDDYERWVRDQKAAPAAPSGLAARGKTILEESQCISCHTIEGTKATGTTAPNLTHFASRTTFAGAIFVNNEENLRKWLADAPAAKPGSKMPAGKAEMGLSDDDITALIAYLQSLE
jgi:cytochrome c oxidase subunit II